MDLAKCGPVRGWFEVPAAAFVVGGPRSTSESMTPRRPPDGHVEKVVEKIVERVVSERRVLPYKRRGYTQKAVVVRAQGLPS